MIFSFFQNAFHSKREGVLKKRKIIWKLTQFISTGAVAEGEVFF